mgnify:CR=1 FL=1
MALPKQSTPIYNDTVPSTEQSIKFRPFLVKEEKSLLLAQQSEDVSVMVDTIKTVLSDCIIDDIDVNRLAVFDIEYLISKIRAKSVGEIVELIFPCDVCTDPKARVTIRFDLTKLNIQKDPDHTRQIPLFDSVGVMMKYPSINTIKTLELSDMGIDEVFDLVSECIDYIYDENEIYHTSEQPKSEIIDFINNLTQEQFGKIQKFFETMPKLRQDVNYTCPVCGRQHDKYIEGIESFL